MKHEELRQKLNAVLDDQFYCYYGDGLKESARSTANNVIETFAQTQEKSGKDFAYGIIDTLTQAVSGAAKLGVEFITRESVPRPDDFPLAAYWTAEDDDELEAVAEDLQNFADALSDEFEITVSASELESIKTFEELFRFIDEKIN